jgi:hypothetical protein
MDLEQLLSLVPEAGATGLLVFFIVAVSKGWILFKREVDSIIAAKDELEAERNDWRELALRGTDLAEGLAKVQQRKFGVK